MPEHKIVNRTYKCEESKTGTTKLVVDTLECARMEGEQERKEVGGGEGGPSKNLVSDRKIHASEAEHISPGNELAIFEYSGHLHDCEYFKAFNPGLSGHIKSNCHVPPTYRVTKLYVRRLS